MITTIDGKNPDDKDAWTEAETVTDPPSQGIRNERTLQNLGKWLAVNAMTMKVGRMAFQQAGYAEPDLIAFPEFKGKPKKGTYFEKMVKQGKIKCLPPDEG